MIKMRLSDKILTSLIPKTYKALLYSRGRDFVEKIGDEVIRGVLLNVLSGGNLRDSTEMITRKRLCLLNAATLSTFVSGAYQDNRFATVLPNIATNQLKAGVKKDERWFFEWSLGLTDKAIQNVLRDDPKKLDDYKDRFITELTNATHQCAMDYGKLEGQIKIDNKIAKIDWLFMIQLLTTIGAQTLAIRGSEKSTYGKLFEPLTLGSVLTLLGFRQVHIGSITDTNNVFWLSERTKREADATVLCGPGKGIRFDIGFIGRGNPEITLDKVSRFEREIEIKKQKYYMATFILVDRVGKDSRIEELAKEIDGTIIQMSMGYWPKILAQELKSKIGYFSPVADMNESELRRHLEGFVSIVDYTKFLKTTEKA